MSRKEKFTSTRTRRRKPITPILQFSIVEQSGIIIFHRSFEESRMDEILFSGFSAAIIAFARELGTELYSIQMANILYYFKDVGTFFYVVGVPPRVRKRDIKRFLKTLEAEILSLNLNSMINEGVYYITEDFQSFLLQHIIKFQIEYNQKKPASTA